MLWSLLKILLFVAIVIGLTFGIERLLDVDEGLRIAVGGIELTLGPLQTVAGALILLGVVWLIMKVVGLIVATLRFLNGDETAVTRYFTRSREQRGLQALVDAMTALASGEPRTAIARAARAEKLLGKPELTRLISAQAAEMQGDRDRAGTYFRELLEDRRTKFVGVRGLLRQKLEQGDKETALKLAEKALSLRPDHPETQQTLLTLQAGQRDWAGARKTLMATQRTGGMPRELYQRRDAVLALQQSADLAASGNAAEAHEAAMQANRMSPQLVPAAVAAARALIAEGKGKAAVKLLKKTWTANPHPDLAAAFAEIETNEKPADRLARFQPLLQLQPDHPETRMLNAELLIAAEDFPAARRAIAPLVEAGVPTARVLTIMAAVERGQGAQDAVVRGWLAKALTAPRGPQWVCDSCQNIHGRWVALCENCGSFDTLSWREPAERPSASPTGTEMLPLIVGEDAAPAAEEATVLDAEEARPAN